MATGRGEKTADYRLQTGGADGLEGERRRQKLPLVREGISGRVIRFGEMVEVLTVA